MVEIWKGFINGITGRGEKDLGNSSVSLQISTNYVYKPLLNYISENYLWE
jgi:hypothetical protein